MQSRNAKLSLNNGLSRSIIDLADAQVDVCPIYEALLIADRTVFRTFDNRARRIYGEEKWRR